MPGGPPSTAVTLPSCLMPESFNGSGDFEDYIQQFNTAAMLAGWLSPRHDHRQQFFALRLRDNALHFYTILSPEQQDDYDLLGDAFRQNYTTNVDILKARPKAAKEQPKQEIANFLCDLRTLARRAYRASPHLIDQIVLTSFVEGLKSPALRWELRKAKPRTAEEALKLTIELDSFIALERTNYPGSASQGNFSVNQIGNAIPQPETIDELVRSLRYEVDNIKRSTYYRNDSRDKHRNRTDSLDKNRDRSNSRDRQPKYFESTDRNQQNSKYSGEKRNNSQDRNSRSVRLSFIAEMKAAGETITHVMDPEIRNRIITDKALLTRIRETSQPIVVETIVSKTHSVTVPTATVNPVIIVDDQIIFQTNAKHTSIANTSDISAVIARRPEPFR